MKFFGKIGFNQGTVETRPGIWKPKILERKYYGDILRNNRHFESGKQINDNINIDNQISILADPYANDNSSTMIYVTFMGAKWKISSIEVQFPRLILTLGGLYNEEDEGESTSDSD